ncbi:MAG: hypothetical protein GY869_24985 [Planctomycetes bacterium]|nr:hypothetical protein [Planctomycetota bacterium]
MGFGKGAVMNYRRKEFVFVVVGLGFFLFNSMIMQKAAGQGYRYESLRDLSDEEIMVWMGAGNSETDEWDAPEAEKWERIAQSPPNRVPDIFWELEPKEAAMSLVEANRPDKHREFYQLTYSEDDDAMPDKCFIDLEYSRTSGYSSAFSSFNDQEIVIGLDPNDSYVIFNLTERSFVHSMSGGASFGNFSLYYWDVEYEELRRLVEVLYWLSQIESKSIIQDWQVFSEYQDARFDEVLDLRLDGSIQLEIEFPGSEGNNQERSAIDIYPSIQASWVNDYFDEHICNIFLYLIRDVWMKRMAEENPRCETATIFYSDDSNEKVSTENLDRIKRNIHRIIADYTSGSKRVPISIVYQSVAVVNELLFAEMENDLRLLLGKVPVGERRSMEEMKEDAAAWESFRVWRKHDYLELDDIGAYKEYLSELNGDADRLREEIGDALWKMERASDAEALCEAVQNRDKMKRSKYSWALKSLREKFPERYLDMLEERMASEDENESEEAFIDIVGFNHERAFKIVERQVLLDEEMPFFVIPAYLNNSEARDIDIDSPVVQMVLEMIGDSALDDHIRTAGIDALRSLAGKISIDQFGPIKKGKMAIAAWNYLLVSDPESVTSEHPILKLVIETTLESYYGYRTDYRSIEALVPYNDPGRYPFEEIDEMLLKLVQVGEADYQVCRALAVRHGARYYDKLLAVVQFYLGSDHSTSYLDSLAWAAGQGNDEQRRQLEEVLLGQLEWEWGIATLDSIVGAIWIADMQSMREQLQQIATAGPEVFEGNDFNTYITFKEQCETPSRYHRARQILSIWDEEDALTRAKLVMCFGWHKTVMNYVEQRRLFLTLEDAVVKLSREDREELALFVDWLGVQPGPVDELIDEPIPFDYPVYDQEIVEFFSRPAEESEFGIELQERQRERRRELVERFREIIKQ